ncbi:hypothetical protein NCCP691_24440 [Noviherbaspirillum aridicola]|uniref:MSHA biogenesis protein MshO n=2 Tax=Noviherbaspirillum aridicola TaxID=2849687 RepID=A0ABQ4Q6K1_9BURK|nr:hypothetical protein NCCP691_24440 [Noviherbaspirillum aridicola]
MVVVIVITAIIGAVIAVFIRVPVQGYADSVARADLTDVADIALRRMSRDLRLALPNSVRIAVDGTGNQYLELLLTKSGGRYLSEEDADAGNPNRWPLKFEAAVDCAATPTDCRFSVVGPMPNPPVIAGADSIVVYNLGPNLEPANAYDCGASGCNRAAVAGVDDSNRIITLASNPFAVQQPAMTSPTRRFQVVSTPVTYTCAGGRLTRYWGYAISKNQPTSAAALGNTSALLATDVAGCSFEYNQLANVRSALVGLTLRLTAPAGSNAGEIALFHQVHVDNTP